MARLSAHAATFSSTLQRFLDETHFARYGIPMLRRAAPAVLLASIACGGGGTEPGGSLGTLPDSVLFDAFFADPAPSVISLTGVGGEASWSASSTSSWLTFTPSSGQTPTNLTIVADPAGRAGTLTALANVTSGGASFAIPVRMTLPSVAGSWIGSASGTVLQLTLLQANANIAGYGVGIQGGGNPDSLGITGGQQSHPQVSFTMLVPGFQPFTFSGSFASVSTLSGRLNGSGFSNAAISLSRVP